MSLTTARSPIAHDTWRAQLEEVTRGQLVELANLAIRNPQRTYPEQQALLGILDILDGDERQCDVALLRAMAEESFVRSHVCDCGEVTPGYWCSPACQRIQDGPGLHVFHPSDIA